MIPERGDGERPATVRGMVWRMVLLFAWYVGVYVANIWYYLAGHGEYRHMDLAILSWFGVSFHHTVGWVDGIVDLLLFFFSFLAPLHVSMLMIVGSPKRKCRLFCLLIALLMPVCAAGAFTEPVLDHADWGADFPDRYPNIVPGLIASVVGVALVAGFAFWGVVQNRKGDGGRLARWTVEHGRGAYWLWPAAIAVVSESFWCVFGMVAIIYGL